MKKNFFLKNVILLLITFLLLWSSTSQVFGKYSQKKTLNTLSNGNILYVGGNGPNNYSFIRDAVDDAVDGDTVFVYSGFYHQYDIYVDKSINIVGENKNTTIIDGYGGARIFRLNKGNISISGFTMQNTYKKNKDSSAIFSYHGDNSIFCNNIFINNKGSGIHSDYADNVYIHHNSFFENQNYAITIGWKNTNTIIERNIIKGNRNGIRTEDNNGVIKRNIIIDNNKIGIKIDEWGKRIKIILNNIVNNSEEGIRLQDASRVLIALNNIYNNKVYDSYFVNTYFNIWFRNYWGTSISGPKLIKGIRKVPIEWDIWGDPTKWKRTPAYRYDRFPAKKEFDIKYDDVFFDVKTYTYRNYEDF